MKSESKFSAGFERLSPVKMRYFTCLLISRLTVINARLLSRLSPINERMSALIVRISCWFAAKLLTAGWAGRCVLVLRLVLWPFVCWCAVKNLLTHSLLLVNYAKLSKQTVSIWTDREASYVDRSKSKSCSNKQWMTAKQSSNKKQVSTTWPMWTLLTGIGYYCFNSVSYTHLTLPTNREV